MPAKHSHCPERIPAARRADRLVKLERERSFIGMVKEPSAVGLPRPLQDADGLAKAGIRPPAGGSEVVERTQNVIVIAGWECELEEFRTDDLTIRTAPEQGTLKKIILRPPSC